LTVNTSPIVLNWPGASVNVTTCVGQTVVWRNTDSVYSHTATGVSGPPTTGDIQPGTSSVPQSFPGPGTYPFHCDYHASESGTVTIQ
jgi:plastocyanin